MLKLSENSRPVVGISPGFAGPDPSRKFAQAGRIVFCDLNYTEGVENAGGMPFLIPFTSDQEQIERVADHIDGLVLIGGVDVHPKHYGQTLEPTEQQPVDERDEFEFRFLDAFLKREKPIFAICRGFQVINIALCGTLVQDIPSKLGPVHHLQTPGSQTVAHQVTLDQGSMIHKILGETLIDVNSFHHQTIDKLGNGLRAVGRSEEGLIEVFEHESHPYLIAVQWHPERMRNSEQQKMLFNDFVKACSREQLELVS
ncbi:MAG: gamma-glutamyl-gamma-aminobutyrate hydrolase family protein [Calditrichaeota bacterium]|nr:gamma-glutamyl-gamma-aminobutyrate hydrolase family protein [Calditrichota bacterium]MCB9368166.1 gamma-glutamyl-gamma-aminobutyrate hydrolase family protein [Calditrichota bacterium]